MSSGLDFDRIYNVLKYILIFVVVPKIIACVSEFYVLNFNLLYGQNNDFYFL